MTIRREDIIFKRVFDNLDAVISKKNNINSPIGDEGLTITIPANNWVFFKEYKHSTGLFYVEVEIKVEHIKCSSSYKMKGNIKAYQTHIGRCNFGNSIFKNDDPFYDIDIYSDTFHADLFEREIEKLINMLNEDIYVKGV